MGFFKSSNLLNCTLQVVLLIALTISFYIFVKSMILSDEKKNKISTWQFPMLLAIYIDTIYYS